MAECRRWLRLRQSNPAPVVAAVLAKSFKNIDRESDCLSRISRGLKMKPMQILWKRLVKGGETCTRCEATGRELKAAVAKLEAVLRPLGIEPVLETHEIDEIAFKSNTSESNRVWITGKPIEEWLGANVGMNRCCSVCGESDCRTLEVGARSYETLPEEQFIKAGLMAASQMIASESSPNKTASSCCSSESMSANSGAR